MKKDNNRPIILGVFLDYIMESNYSREGISRYLFNLLESLLSSSDIQIEIWTRILNKNIVESEYLEELILAYPGRIKICYEIDKNINNRNVFWLCLYEIYNLFIGRIANWRSVPALYAKNVKDKSIYSIINIKILFLLSLISRGLHKKILHHFFKHPPVCETLLVKKANKYSSADLFIIPYVSIFSSSFLKQKKLLALHDLFSVEYEDRFKIIDPSIVKFNKQVLEFCESFNSAGNYFICHSASIKNTIERYIANSSVYSVYLPCIEIKSSGNKNDLLNKYKIKKNFIFYPTQIRPYKNVEVILEAISLLKQKFGIELTLVLTGKMSSYPPVLELCHKLNLTNSVIEIGSISQEDLYGLYELADLSVVPTLSEGGFPWQALEAIYCSCPVVLSDIPVVRERLEFAKAPEEIINNLLLFEPNNSVALWPS